MERQRFVRSFDGTRLFTASCGSGPTVVLCDGIGCDGFIWRELKGFLRERYRVIHWNYRGHGQSAMPADPDALGMPALMADLHTVLEAYDVDKAVFLGHSMGVQVILEAALQWPERVRALVPMCGSYGRPLDTLHGNGHMGAVFPFARDAVLRWPHRGQRLWRALVASKLALLYANHFEVNGRVLQNGDMKAYFDHLGSMDAKLFVRMLDRIHGHNVEERLPDIKVPTLVIAGERDTFTPAWLSHRMHLRMPKAELLVVPGGSHVAPLEIPELVNLRLQRFLNEQVLVERRVSTPHEAATVAVRANAARA